MTGSDLIVLLWLVFGAVVTVVFLLLRTSRRPPSRLTPWQSALEEMHGPVTGLAGQPAERNRPGARSLTTACPGGFIP